MYIYFLLHAVVRVSVVLVRHFKSLVIVVWVALISAPEIAFSDGHSRTWDHQFILNWYHQWEFYRDGHQRDNSRVDMENISVRSRNALHKKCSDKLLLFVDELKNLPKDRPGCECFTLAFSIGTSMVCACRRTGVLFMIFIYVARRLWVSIGARHSQRL